MSRARSHREVILAGSGGQGLVLSAILLAEAAMLDGMNVVQTQSYGIASRGGLSTAEVIIDREEIIFQQVRSPDVVLALTQEAARKFEAWAAKGVPLLYDSTLVAERSGAQCHGAAFTRLANELGQPASVNILALGALVALAPVVSAGSLQEAVRRHFGAASSQANLQALAAGAALIAQPSALSGATA